MTTPMLTVTAAGSSSATTAASTAAATAMSAVASIALPIVTILLLLLLLETIVMLRVSVQFVVLPALPLEAIVVLCSIGRLRRRVVESLMM